jgi:hypothetical protein
MTRYFLLLSGGILLLLLAAPAAASQILTGVSCDPTPPLQPGGHQHMVAQYTIIPSGSTTFPKGHNLQMQTDLVSAQWTIQVIVDGNNAALQTASGPAAFVNGAILSYPTNHDLSFTVTIDGTVPATGTGTVTLLNMTELDNNGSPVPGSQSLVAEPVAGAGSGPATSLTPIPTLTPPPVTPAAAATRSPGFPAPLGIAAVTLAGLAWAGRRNF